MGLAALGGIGFTVSLIVADLAYDSPSLTDQAKLGIFAGSLLNAVIGCLILGSRSRSRLARRERELPAA